MGDKAYTTSNIELSKSATSNNISFLFTAILDNNGNELLGGMTGTLHINLLQETVSTAILIPQTAVCHSQNMGTYLWKVNTETNRVTRIPVKIGNLKADNKIEIEHGVTSDDLIVLTGHSFLSENDIITIQK